MSIFANFVPVRRFLASVTNAQRAAVTTTENHGYFDGQWVRIIVPSSYGMSISYLPTQIEILSETSFRTNLDTRSLLPYLTPTAPPAFTQAHVVPISGTEDNLGLTL
jgi:hypothetical protein